MAPRWLDVGSKRFDKGLPASHRRNARHVVLKCRAANGLFVIMRSSTQRRVDYQGDVTLLNMVSDVRAAFIHFENCVAFETDFSQPRGRAYGRRQIETQPRKPARQHDGLTFVDFVHADESCSRSRQLESGS